MKNSISIIALLLLSAAAYAQNSKFEETMQAAITELYAAETPEKFDDVANKFARVGQAEKSQWEPYYYASLSNVFKSFRIKDMALMDAELDKALVALKQSESLSANNSEIVALEGFINMLKIQVDPSTRGQSLSPKIMGAFGRAMSLDPSNPRATLFMAQMQIGTAQFFGTGIEEPCKMINRSIELFDSAKPASLLSPMWGKSSALQYVKMCEEPSK